MVLNLYYISIESILYLTVSLNLYHITLLTLYCNKLLCTTFVLQNSSILMKFNATATLFHGIC